MWSPFKIPFRQYVLKISFVIGGVLKLKFVAEYGIFPPKSPGSFDHDQLLALNIASGQVCNKMNFALGDKIENWGTSHTWFNCSKQSLELEATCRRHGDGMEEAWR
jgi:hypothetical protein